MSKSTTIINHLNTDRVTEIIISERKYILFTLNYRNLIVIECSKDNPVLLLNRAYSSRKALSEGIDKIILAASKAIDNDDFINEMDTYIHLNDVSNFDTTEEITAVYKIIAEDYNL